MWRQTAARFSLLQMECHVLDTLGIRQEFSAIGGTSQWHWTLWVEVLYGLWLLICFQKCNIVLLNWNCWWEVGNCWFVGIGCCFFTFFEDLEAHYRWILDRWKWCSQVHKDLVPNTITYNAAMDACRKGVGRIQSWGGFQDHFLKIFMLKKSCEGWQRAAMFCSWRAQSVLIETNWFKSRICVGSIMRI